MVLKLDVLTDRTIGTAYADNSYPDLLQNRAPVNFKQPQQLFRQ